MPDPGRPQSLRLTEITLGEMSAHRPDNPESEPVLQEYLSVLAADWIRAMEPHFDVLIALARPAAADTLEVSPREVAHSISIMVMTAFLMESNAGRLAALGRLPRASVTGGRSTPGTDLDAVDLIRDALSDAPEDRVPELCRSLHIPHEAAWSARDPDNGPSLGRRPIPANRGFNSGSVGGLRYS